MKKVELNSSLSAFAVMGKKMTVFFLFRHNQQICLLLAASGISFKSGLTSWYKFLNFFEKKGLVLCSSLSLLHVLM
jgi:hypothetical protein